MIRTLLQAPVQGDRDNVRAGTRNGDNRLYRTATIVRGSAQIETRAVPGAPAPAEGQEAPTETIRRVRVIWTTGAEVARYDWRQDIFYYEGLEVSDTAVDLQRLNDTGPVLDTHWSYGLESLLGYVERAWLENGIGYADLVISDTPDLDTIWRKIENGTIRTVSVGYTTQQTTITIGEDQIERRTATKWQPGEISFVPMPADTGCIVVRSEENAPNSSDHQQRSHTMAIDNPNPGGAGADTQTPTTETRDAPQTPPNNVLSQGELERRNDIRGYCRAHGIDASVGDEAIDGGTSFSSFARAQVNAIAERGRSHEQRQGGGGLEERHRNGAAQMALRAQAFVADMRGVDAEVEAARAFQGRSLADHAAYALSLRGIDVTGLPAHEIISAALNSRGDDPMQRNLRDPRASARSGGLISTNDLPALLGPTVAASFDRGYLEDIEDITYLQWATVRSVPNYNSFKTVRPVGLSGIQRMPEGSPFPLGSMSENGTLVKTDDAGMMLIFTHRAARNDQFGMFLDFVAQVGELYRLWEESEMVAMLNDPVIYGLNGPEAVFDDKYGNDIGTVVVTDDGFLRAARLALRNQKDVDKNGEEDTFVRGYTADVILCSSDLEDVMTKFTSPNFTANNQSNISLNTRLKVIVVPGMEEGTFIVGSLRMIRKNFRYVRLDGENGVNIWRVDDPLRSSAQWASRDTFEAACEGRLGMVRGRVAA